MKQKLIRLGSSLTRNEIKKVNGGKEGNLKMCHNIIDGLANSCIGGHCFSSGKGVCNPNNETVCEADLIDYCCCTINESCTIDSDCSIHGGG